MKPYVFHPEAHAELVAAGRYYMGTSAPLAERFYEEINAVLAEVRARPSMRRMFDPPARRHFGPAFPYALIYVDRPDEIWIVAVMHFKQVPGYWRARLPA
ncbi:MAG: type II toxin-antitoxin system RelE/ParE family toxin [Opitutaceae bacterium]|nr:type II toxin-antitoxin system RelE/ParE family toxin [Opitutaceae bacterium]